MSDYLWDKTGEPEADVEQLENLLGALKYQPRPLEIPASAMPRADAPTRPTIFFSRPRLAIAASLLLTLLAGLWFVTRQSEPRENQVATVNKGSETGGSKQPEKAVVTPDHDGNNNLVNNASSKNADALKPIVNRAGGVRATTPERRRAPRRLDINSEALKARLQVLAQKVDDPADVEFDKERFTASPELVATNAAPRWQVEQPLTPEQREATEKLMLALRVASVKFNYAQREMKEIGRAGK